MIDTPCNARLLLADDEVKTGNLHFTQVIFHVLVPLHSSFFKITGLFRIYPVPVLQILIILSYHFLTN